MTYDLVIIGAGPGGMQAAIAAASEGLTVLVLERDKVGGQIGQTPKLENSVFTAGGITGPEFARMMKQQALDMGAEIRSGEVFNLKDGTKGKTVKAKHKGKLKTYTGHTVVLAMGNNWTELDIPGLRPLVNRHVFIGPVKSINYNATGRDVMVYGGGPSAGQAVLALADSLNVGRVLHVMRSGFRMPRYLEDRIRAHRSKVTIHEHATISSVRGFDGREIGVTMIVDLKDSDTHVYAEVDALFMCNGLTPATGWLAGVIDTDPNGRILTKSGHLETSMPGVFAIGDCRSGSTPRVGVAIGDGSMAVTEVWNYFARNPVCRDCKRVFPAA